MTVANGAGEVGQAGSVAANLRGMVALLLLMLLENAVGWPLIPATTDLLSRTARGESSWAQYLSLFHLIPLSDSQEILLSQ